MATKRVIPIVSNFRQKKDVYVNKFESVIFTCKCVIYRPEHDVKRGPHGIEF